VSEAVVQAFVEQATSALQGGQPYRALELADQALAVDIRSVDATLIRAIALSQLQRVEESTATFEQAQALDPNSAKVSYNFAVHLHAIGRMDQARAQAETTLRLQPNHASARQLLGFMDAQAQPEGPTSGPPTAAPPVMGEQFLRPGYGVPEHSVQWIGKLGSTWLAIGWGLAVASLAHFLASFAVFYSVIAQMFSNSQARPAMPSGPLFNALSILGWVVIVAVVFWVIADLLDRRGNWFWLVPNILCCCFGMSWVSLSLYIALGRNRPYA
jgi:tetratricopeptide (TPR) repeat protein